MGIYQLGTGCHEPWISSLGFLLPEALTYTRGLSARAMTVLEVKTVLQHWSQFSNRFEAALLAFANFWFACLNIINIIRRRQHGTDDTFSSFSRLIIQTNSSNTSSYNERFHDLPNTYLPRSYLPIGKVYFIVLPSTLSFLLLWAPHSSHPSVHGVDGLNILWPIL